jgi:hypothetical protein
MSSIGEQLISKTNMEKGNPSGMSRIAVAKAHQ